ncbi:MAG: hypothetical protein FGM52_12580 [Mycobacterium sp.]|nr:hypothetical protein [Mycobacterium sp.]
MAALLAFLVGMAVLGLTSSGAAPAPRGPGLSGPAPQEVLAGVYVVNIPTVNPPRNSFDADFYLWLRWRGEAIDPPEGIRVMNVFERWALETENVYDEPQTQPDGSKLWVVHYHGNFSTPLSLRRFPFDRQTLTLIIEDEVLTARRITFKPDDSPIRLSPDITLPGYAIGDPRITFGEFTYDVGPVERVQQDWTFPRITVEVPLTAPVASGVVKIFVPIVIVLAAAALALVVPPAHVESTIALPITSLLALVAMHWGVSSSLPDVGYLLMIDVLYIVAYAAATTFLAVAIAGAWVLRSRGEAAAGLMQRRMLVVTVLGYLIVVGAVLAGYLTGS